MKGLLPMVKPRNTLRHTCLLVVSSLIFSHASSADEGVPRPNVLMISVDDMNDWVNVMGGYRGTVQTPNLDRLAEQGTLFANAHCPSPVCGPSPASILSGRHAVGLGGVVAEKALDQQVAHANRPHLGNEFFQ